MNLLLPEGFTFYFKSLKLHVKKKKKRCTHIDNQPSHPQTQKNRLHVSHFIFDILFFWYLQCSSHWHSLNSILVFLKVYTHTSSQNSRQQPKRYLWSHRFRFLILCHALTVWPWASNLASLNFTLGGSNAGFTEIMKIVREIC